MDKLEKLKEKSLQSLISPSLSGFTLQDFKIFQSILNDKFDQRISNLTELYKIPIQELLDFEKVRRKKEKDKEKEYKRLRKNNRSKYPIISSFGKQPKFHVSKQKRLIIAFEHNNIKTVGDLVENFTPRTFKTSNKNIGSATMEFIESYLLSLGIRWG